MKSAVDVVVLAVVLAVAMAEALVQMHTRTILTASDLAVMGQGESQALWRYC